MNALEADEAVAGRVVAELRALGLVVVLASAGGALLTPGELEARVRAAGAEVGIRVVPPGPGRGGEGPTFEVWLIDRMLDVFTARHVVGAPGERIDAVAIRAAEVVRASLLEVEAHPPSLDDVAGGGEAADAPRRAPDAGAASREALAPAALPAATVAAGRAPDGGALVAAAALTLGFVHHPSAASLLPTYLAGLEGRLAWRGVVGGTLLVTVPIAPSYLDGDQGSARVLEGMAAAGATVRAVRAGRIELAFDALGGGAWLHLRGNAVAPFEGRSVAWWTPVALARATVSVRLGGGPLRACVGVFAGAATRKLAVRFDDVVVAWWGPALFGAAAGIQLSL